MFEGRANKIILFFIYISIFCSAWVLFTRPFEFYVGYFVFILMLPVYIFRYGFPRWTLIFILLLIFGLFNILLDNNTAALFFKIFIGLFGSYLFYYYVILESDYNVEKLFRLYLKGAYIVSIIGLVQFVSYQVGFEPGYNYQWLFPKWGITTGGNFGIRVNAIFPEPTHYGAFMAVAIFVAMYDMIILKPYYYNKLQCVLIIIIYLLSFSGLAYLGIMLGIILLFFNFGLIRYFVIAIPAGLIIFNFMYNNSLEFKLRYDSTISIFSTGEFSIGQTHGSSIILYNNYHIAVENFKSNFLFGTGLGGHPVAAEKYSLTKDIETPGFQLNYADANSMFVRLMSETGLFGLVIMFYIIFKHFVRRTPGSGSNHWLISNSILVLIIISLLRQGHYFFNGFPFFIWLYIYNYREYVKLAEADEPKN